MKIIRGYCRSQNRIRAEKKPAVHFLCVCVSELVLIKNLIRFNKKYCKGPWRCAARSLPGHRKASNAYFEKGLNA